MDLHFALDENFLWASMFWGAVAGGYLIYGWRQKAGIPLAAGVAMTLMSFIGPNALVMSLVCLGIIGLVWWLLKRGY
jgi:Flp pilus assembly protein TadB